MGDETQNAELAQMKELLAKEEETSRGYLEQIKRLQADFENWRKRVEQEKLFLTETASLSLVQKLLPVLDNFERATAHSGEGKESATLQDGMNLIYRQLSDILKEEGLTPIEALGKTFDPALHEAYAYEERNGAADHAVIEEARRGYQFKGKLVRPSLVKVSKIPVESK